MKHTTGSINRIVLLFLILSCLFGPIFPFLNVDLGFVILTPLRLALILSTAYCFFVWMIRYRKQQVKMSIHNNRDGWFVFLFLAIWFMAGCAWLVFGEVYSRAPTEVVGILTICLFAFCTFTLVECLEDSHDLLRACVYGGVILSLLAFVEVVFGSFVPGTRYYLTLEEKLLLKQTLFAPTAVFYNQNDFAAYLLMCVTIVCFWMLQCKRIKPFLLYLVIGIVLLIPTFLINSTIFNLSLIALLVFASALLLLMAKQEGRHRLIQIGILLAAIVLFGAFGANVIKNTVHKFNMSYFSHRIEKQYGIDSYDNQEELLQNLTEENKTVSANTDTLFTQIDAANNATGTIYKRYWLIRAGIDFFFDSPIVGNGPDSFREKIEKHTEYQQKTGGLVNPHCFYTEILSQYGGVLFSLFVGSLLYFIIMSACRAYKELKMGYAGMNLLCFMLFAVFTVVLIMSSSSICFTTIWMFYIFAVGLFCQAWPMIKG